MIDISKRNLFTPEHDQFRETVRKFIAREFLPNIEKFEQDGKTSRAFWQKAGETGLLCPMVPEEYGGLGLNFLFNVVINEELSYAGASDCLTLQNDISLPYMLKYCTHKQKKTYLPLMVSGEIITAIAMTEPDAGSDLQGIKTTAVIDGQNYIVNGSKTYITNGQNADLILSVVKTAPDAGAKGTSILLVEAISPGFSRGKNLDKVGQWSADTSELFFTDMRVPRYNLLGQENRGFLYNA